MELYAGCGLDKDMTLQLFGCLGQFLSNVLFMEWIHLAIDDKRGCSSYVLADVYARKELTQFKSTGRITPLLPLPLGPFGA